KLTGDEIKKLEDVFTHCASLECLALSNNDLTSKEAEILAGILANNKTIQSLSLNNNKIGDNGLKAFAKIAEKSPVTFLNFSDNNISDRGFKFWAETLKKNTSLTNFNFHNNKIHDEGAKALAEALLSNTSIKRFTIVVEGLTNETIELLRDVVNDKDIIVKQSLATKLLPDALDVWVEEVIPALQLKPTEQLSNHEEAGSVTNETTPQQAIVVVNPETTLELLDKYGKKFKTVLEKGEILDKLNIKPNPIRKEDQKALIILGNPGSGKTTLANLFATETLTIGMNKEGKLLKLKDSLGFSLPLDYSSSNKAVINIAKPDPNLIICESNYLHDTLSTPEKIINEFYITKILSNYPTKFIVTIKDSELENGFIAIIEKLSILLKDIPLTPDSLYLVVTDVPTRKNSDHIFYTLVDIVRKYSINCNLNHTYEAWGKKQQEIEGCLAEQTSICLFPAFSPGTINLDNFKEIFQKSFPTLTNNKVTISSMNMMELLSLQTFIKHGLIESISELSEAISKKWQDEKNTIFNIARGGYDGGTLTPPDSKALKALIGIFKKLTNKSFDTILDNNAKLLALNNAVFSALNNEELKELTDKLSNYIDYLKYFTAISVDNRENINTNMHENWFEMLADGVLSIGDINKQLIEAFKDNIQGGESPFCKKLELALENFCNSIENIKKLTPNTLNNIDCLKNLQEIFTTKEISSFKIIKHNLFTAVNILFLNDNEELNGKCLKDFITYNIKILTKLIEKPTPEILTEIWQGFTGSVSVSTNIDETIYNKLLTAIIEPGLSMGFYSQLEELLKYCGRGNESNPEYKEKMAEIYCKMGNGGFDGAELFESYNPSEVMGNTVGFDPAFIG
ncbi:MAG: hypothetical protein LN573_01240, partial [Rickettsia endosymbiont of Oxypoda opaca]|nr:hypothetical protein [Rickettsia endosymbiont of Oxypoda opaca]